VTAHIVSLSAPQGAVAWDESVRAERGAMPGVRSLLVAAAIANGTEEPASAPGPHDLGEPRGWVALPG